MPRVPAGLCPDDGTTALIFCFILPVSKGFSTTNSHCFYSRTKEPSTVPWKGAGMSSASLQGFSGGWVWEDLGKKLREETSRRQQGGGHQGAGLWRGPVPAGVVGEDPTCCPDLGKARLFRACVVGGAEEGGPGGQDRPHGRPPLSLGCFSWASQGNRGCSWRSRGCHSVTVQPRWMPWRTPRSCQAGGRQVGAPAYVAWEQVFEGKDNGNRHHLLSTDSLAGCCLA